MSAPMDKPRILHLFNAFRVGGVERQHMLLVKHLQNDFDQTCWAINHGPAEDFLDDLSVPHHCGPFSMIPEIMEASTFDCVVVRTTRVLFDLTEYLRDSPVPVVYTRNYIRWPNLEYFDYEWEKRGVDMADYCLFSGPMLRDPVMAQLDDVPGGEIIYNGLELDAYPLAPRKAPPADRPLRACILANINPHKNQLRAIEVLGDDLAANRCELHLAGSPFDEEYAADVGRAAQGLPVHLHGHVTDQIGFLGDMDVLLVPSTHEGWPNVIMEAFACGVPVISTDIGDIREVFGPGGPGLLYPAGEHERIPALMEQIRHPETYEHMSAATVKRARDFDIRLSARQLANAVHAVIKP
jgi:glycosyltransferase involved in cell wall biosynthesis